MPERLMPEEVFGGFGGPQVPGGGLEAVAAALEMLGDAHGRAALPLERAGQFAVQQLLAFGAQSFEQCALNQRMREAMPTLEAFKKTGAGDGLERVDGLPIRKCGRAVQVV
jgi:hypothetical protein